MKITLAKSAGFCFGVKRAIDIALSTARTHPHVEMLGDIVHNEQVVAQIKKEGIKKICRLGNGSNKTLLIRAHGAAHSLYVKAHAKGYTIVDATCPMVKEIHTISRKAENAGFHIIVIGDKEHDEVKGIVGQLKKPSFIISHPLDIPRIKRKRLQKAAVVVQSTQNYSYVKGLVSSLKTFIPDLTFFNTICSPTRRKQSEIATLSQKNDVMIIIGSKQSANTRRLYEIAKSFNSRTYWIQTEQDIRSRWFYKVTRVGISAGASTPDSLTHAVIAKVQSFQR